MKVLKKRNIKITFLVVSLTSLFVLMISLVSQFLFLEVKILLMNSLKQFLKSMITAKKYWKSTSTKIWSWVNKKKNNFNQVTLARFVKNLIVDDNEKVRGHCPVTGKSRGAAHWDCIINLQLTKKVPVIFRNLRGYHSHLIFCEFNKFDVKID